MPWFSRPARPGPVLRTRLWLESLDDRAVPTSLFGGDPEPLLLAENVAEPPPAAAPVITSFSAEQVACGWYYFTGRVELVDGSAGGLTVTLAGIPSLEGWAVTTEADGTFSLFIAVQTDGSDTGMATAQTTANGQESNLAMCYVDPTNPPPTP